MKGKTKTILTVISAILVFAIAVVGTVIFLKDDGETNVAEVTTNVLPVTSSDDEQINTDGEQNPEETLNEEETPAKQPEDGENENSTKETTENENSTKETTGTESQGITGTTINQGTTAGGQTEPKPIIIEQERLVSTTLNWTNISLNSTIGRTKINYTKLGYTIKYYQVNEGEIIELNTETGKEEYGAIVIVTKKQLEDNCPAGYKLDEENSKLSTTITENVDGNVIEVYYERNTFEYKVEYYKNSAIEANKLGETVAKEQKFGTVMSEELVAADFGEIWLNAYKPTVGYQDGEVAQYITIQANSDNVIQVVYKPQTNIPYTVEYYFNEVIDNTKTDTTGKATFGETIETVTDYSNNGEWTVDTTKSTVLPFEIVEVSGNVIKVYYIKPDIAVVKTRTVNTNRTTGAPDIVEPGETITYTITATNNGYKEGTVNIGDSKPEGTILTEGTAIVATGYDTVTEAELAEGIDLTVPAQGTASVTFTVTVVAKPGKDVINIPDINGEQDTSNKVTNPVEKTISVKAKTQTITNSNIVIVIDTSLSMSYVRCNSDRCNDRSHEHMMLSGSDGTHLYHKDETKINAAKKVTNEFIDKVNLSNDANNIESTVAIIQFDGNTADVGMATLASKKDTLKNAVLAMETHSSTNMSNALTAAKNKFTNLKAGNNNIVIFLSDGEPTDSRSGVKTASAALKGVATVYTIGFGAEADTDILQNTIASSTDKYFPATDGNYSSLSSAFQQAVDDLSDFKPKQSIDGLIALTGVYADANHPIKITANSTLLEDITSLPTDKLGYVILDNGNYYLDLSKFGETDTITIEYYAK